MDLLLLGIGIGWFAHLLFFGRRPDDSAGDIMIAPKRPTRVVRHGEHGGHQPDVSPVDWSRVTPPPTGSAIQRPAANPRLKDRG